jgi:hypothetical protein
MERYVQRTTMGWHEDAESVTRKSQRSEGEGEREEEGEGHHERTGTYGRRAFLPGLPDVDTARGAEDPNGGAGSKSGGAADEARDDDDAMRGREKTRRRLTYFPVELPALPPGSARAACRETRGFPCSFADGGDA